MNEDTAATSGGNTLMTESEQPLLNESNIDSKDYKATALNNGNGNHHTSSVEIDYKHLYSSYSSMNGDDDNNNNGSVLNTSNNTTPHKGQIGYIGGLSIAINSIIGPAVLDIPFLYQKSGFIPTTLCILLVCFLMAFCCLHMTNIISKLPGNSNFHREIEYSEAFRLLGGYKWFVFTQISYFLCMMCQTIASIVDTAQVVDQFLAQKLGGAPAISFNLINMIQPSISIVTYDKDDCLFDEEEHAGVCDPFEFENGYILSVGYMICAVFFLPLGLLNLKENTIWQIFCLIVTVITCMQFILFFILQGQEHNAFHRDSTRERNLSLWGDSWYSLFGIILFDFTLVTAIPAWLYEKKPNVNASNVILNSTLSTSFLYIILGTLGAMAIPNISQNMLSTMMAGSYGNNIQIGASFFAFIIIGLGVPLFSVLLRLNLTGSGLCSTGTANILAVYLPWAISWLFYNGAAVEQLLSWGGMLFTSICAFLAPFILALKTTFDDSMYKKHNSNETKNDTNNSIPVWLGLKSSTKFGDRVGLSFLVFISFAIVFASIIGQSL